MMPSDAAAAEPLLLAGGPHARGLAQAALCPDMVPAVRHAVRHRLEETAPALADSEVRRFIAAQRDFTERHYPQIMAEIQGIAAGFGIAEAALFDYLHCSSASDLASLAEHAADGCTSFAVTTADGALLAKNRDYRPEHVPIQRVMRHADPDWNGRRILVLGSLGSPGNFSSGINSDGLAVSDTASRTTDMGVGFHRYFLLTWLLVNCASVAEALAAIRRITHTGSGLLVLADAMGAVAAVELGHRRVGVEHRAAGRIGRSNHFVLPDMAAANLDVADNTASRANSIRRFASLSPALEALAPTSGIDAVARVLATHDAAGRTGFCRHGGDDLSTTISGAIYDTAARRMVVALGNPCTAPWRRHAFDPAASAAAAQ
ncbi:MAG: C45 family peptidase [Alphaproteobacteria bacterium]|nr:C45 family peptidase [Alphaproteobacteria bacterium]